MMLTSGQATVANSLMRNSTKIESCSTFDLRAYNSFKVTASVTQLLRKSFKLEKALSSGTLLCYRNDEKNSSVGYING